MANEYAYPFPIQTIQNNTQSYRAFLESHLPFVCFHSKCETPWWNVSLNGSHGYGLSTGKEMANKLLTLYGSGKVAPDNSILASIVTSMMIHFEKLGGIAMMQSAVSKQSEDYKCFEGQYFGFFSKICQFLTPASYVNWQGLNQENNFNPSSIQHPPIWKQENQISVVSQNEPLKMSSREIADLTGKQHSHVMRDIRNTINELGYQSNFGLVKYRDAKGELRDEYQLPKRETLILISGYSIELRARIIDRWQELEKKQTNTPENELLDIRQSIKRLEKALEQFQAKDSITLTIEQSNVAKVDRILKALKRKSDFTTHRELTRSLQNSMNGDEISFLVKELARAGMIEMHYIKNRRGPSSRWYKLVK